MGQHSLNFSEWLRRLGFKHGRGPLFVESIQPVQVVGDASALVPPVLPAMAHAGRQLAQVAAEHPLVALTCRAAGGLFVHSVVQSCSSGGTISGYRVVDAVAAIATPDPTAPTIFNFGVGNVRSTIASGTSATAYDFQGYMTRAAQNETTQWIEPVYVAPGRIFELRWQGPNVIVQWGLSWSEVQTPLNPESAT